MSLGSRGESENKMFRALVEDLSRAVEESVEDFCGASMTIYLFCKVFIFTSSRPIMKLKNIEHGY